MRIHFIAIGGSAMHNLALALHLKGFEISGSDDHFFEPSLGRLKAHGLLPQEEGWYAEKITSALDAVILGMHAKKDNPELIKAQELGIPIYSYPEYIYLQSQQKTRVVIGGSHGKTSITAMVMHALKYHHVDFDYLVGAQLEGFETMVQLSDAPIIIIEGDEYLASSLKPIPKFHFYKANIAVISGIAWDHINVFPTFESYIHQFELFIDSIEPKGSLFYCEMDEALNKLIHSYENKHSIQISPYQLPKYEVNHYQTQVMEEGVYDLQVFGKHNLLNLQAAKNICVQLGLTIAQYWKAMQSFKGASKRLELWYESPICKIYRDFAHAPSKLKATIQAVKEQYADRKLISCLELHTFSSLNKNFLSEYKQSTDESDIFIVYVNKKVLEQKGYATFTKREMQNAFEREDVEFFDEKTSLVEFLKQQSMQQTNLLMMSSGNFGGLQIGEILNVE